MNTLFIILISIFGLSGIATILYAYIPNIKNKPIEQNDNDSLSNEIEKNLIILESETNEKKLSHAFEKLMSLSYVLVHVIVNKGNNYKDEIQCRVFCDYLTSDVVTKIKSLEGNDGEHTL